LAISSHSDEIDIDYRLLSRLRQATDAVFRVRQKDLKKLNITPEQAGALHLIHTFGNQATAFELSKISFRKPSSITMLLRRLERDGLINKTVDKRKKNVIRLSLTSKGQKCYAKVLEMGALSYVFSGLPYAKKKQLCSLLEMIRDNAWENLNVDVNSYSTLLEKLDLLR